MECPKCYGEMDTVLEEGASVDRCQDCHGLYFDQLTQEMLGGILDKVGIDTGTDEMGSSTDDMVYVDCPKCDRMMDQVHIG